jgi:acetyl esterase/lipase
MASPQAEAVKSLLHQLAESATGGNPTIEEMRASAAALGELAAEPEGVTYRTVDARGVPAMWIEPEGAPQDEAILFAHGGGYVACSAESHRKVVGHLARASGARALSIDYRLAPEHPYPAGLDDVIAAYEWLLGQGLAATKVVFGGDSAGGGLVTAAILKLRDEGKPLPAGCFLISPFLDFTATGESMKSRAAVDVMISEDAVKGTGEMYLQGGADVRDPYVSPVFAELAGLPPTYVVVGDDEVLLDDSTRLVERAQAAGVDVTLDLFIEMQHDFVACAGNVPEADDAVQRIGAFVRKQIG